MHHFLYPKMQTCLEIEKLIQRNAKIGVERLRPLVPTDAKAVIIGTLRVNECDSYTDYYDYSIARTVILGFSKHTRNLFSEMRKHAANFEGTAYLAEYNADYEHRENYSMGDGMYLGRNKYSGWTVGSVAASKDKPFTGKEATFGILSQIDGNGIPASLVMRVVQGLPADGQELALVVGGTR